MSNTLTLEKLKEHCKKTIDPANKLVFDVNSRTYQEHKMVLDLIEENEQLKNNSPINSLIKILEDSNAGIVSVSNCNYTVIVTDDKAGAEYLMECWDKYVEEEE